MSKKPVILTGDRPTGPLHIGHYFGSLILRKEWEEQSDMYVMIADVQALTDNWENPSKVRENVLEVAADNLATGLDPKKTTLFIQSEIPEIAELTVFFSNLVTINRLKRNPTVKTEIEQKKHLFGEEGESLTYGFLGYPVSQAADISSMRANLVPVGADQLPMIEQTREIADRFNRLYMGNVFPLPEAKLSPAPRIIGLDGNAKMSKSLNNAIYLKDEPDEIRQKIKTAKTDSLSHISFDPENRPEISNLVMLYALSLGTTPEDAAHRAKDMKYAEFKHELAEAIIAHFAIFREKRKVLMADPKGLRDILIDGKERAQKRAAETMRMVREAMKIDY